MIYRHVALGARVIYHPGLSPDTKTSANEPVRASTSASLLRCCKLIHQEYLLTFHETACLDITACIDAKRGVVNLPSRVDASMLHHVKVDQKVFGGAGAMVLLRSLSGLKSLTFHGDGLEYHVDSLRRNNIADCECDDNRCNDCMLQTLDVQIDDHRMKLVGQCDCQSHLQLPYAREECFGEKPIRQIVAVWDYLGWPFKLQARAIITGAWTDDLAPLDAVSEQAPFL